jgi:hypothetical protein
MEQYYVGLDVHSRQSTFVIEDGAGQVVARGEVPTTPAALAQLRADHHLPPDTPVALESGTVAFFVARQLAALGLAPQVIDAHEVRLKAVYRFPGGVPGGRSDLGRLRQLRDPNSGVCAD